MDIRYSVGRGIAAAAVVLLVAACGSGPAGDTPAGVVRTALDRAAAKDVTGLAALACAGQGDLVRQQLGVAGGLGADILPGIDTGALMDAVKLDASKMKVGDAAITGDVATVPVSGDLGVTFDAVAMRPIVVKALAAQGRTMSDAQIDALVQGLQAFGQAVPVDQTVRLVQEGGAWKICQDKVNLPSLKP
jgi:hypothetical protein